MYQPNAAHHRSWVNVSPDSDFSIQNLPFGIFTMSQRLPSLCSAIGDYIVDLKAVFDLGYFHTIDGLSGDVFTQKHLNHFIELGKNVTNAVRLRLSQILNTNFPENAQKEASQILILKSEVQLLLPLEIGDYTDFYSSRQHAFNVGSMFRDAANALLPNWLHLPVGYHGRASSIVVSETPIVRPHGQSKLPNIEQPVFGATKKLDFELEMAFVVGKNTNMGQAISVEQADDYIFGLALFNDWSARDIQAWEYVPLGPFLGKNFASTLAPWVVTLEALEPFRVANPVQEPRPLSYLQSADFCTYDVNLTVTIQSETMENPQIISASNFKNMYWNMRQQLAHHTVNGCNVRVGDLCASGTISGEQRDSFGSMLELAWQGTQPLSLSDGSQRSFVEDGDTITLSGFAEKDGVRVGFGEASGKISAARKS